MRTNPFRSQPTAKAKAKPKLSDAARAAIDSGERTDPNSPIGKEIKESLRHSPATRFDLLDIVEQFSGDIKALRKDVRTLQTSLAYAQEEAAKALDANLRQPLTRDDDAPSLAELEAMSAKAKAAKEART